MANVPHTMVNVYTPNKSLMFKKIQHLFTEGDQRTVKIKKNIFASILLKGIDILIYLLLVPLTLGYLNAYEYGIWLTLNSILLWINSFDIGLGNGLRNKLAIAIAKEDWNLGKIYVSTTFYTLVIITLLLFGIIYLCCSYINWYSVLNVATDSVPHLDDVVLFSFACFCLNFVFKFVESIYLAMQLPAITNLMKLLGHGLSLILIWVLTQVTEGSLLYVAVTYSISPVFIYIAAYPITFSWKYPQISPSLKCIQFTYLKDLMGIGMQFFFLQIAGIILFASSNIIISQILGPENVTPYNIAYRYFSVIPLIFAILITPMWSAVTDAYTRGEIDWIKRSMYKIRKLLFLTGIVIFLMIVCADIAYKLWIGSKVSIPFTLTLCMGIYIYILVWSLSYSNFLNGIGKLKLQVINTAFVAVIFYPLAVFLTKIGGVTFMVIAMILTNLSGAILNTMQFNQIIKNRQ